MKRFVAGGFILFGLCGSAFAADLPAKTYTKTPPLLAPYDWTGLYFGVNAGAGFGRSSSEVVGSGAQSRLGGLGAIGGVQLGYNRQIGNIVLGLETDIQGSSMRDNRTCQFCNNEYSFDQKLDWFGTVRGRLGYAGGPVLSYITGGWAYGGVSSTVSLVPLGPPVVGTLSGTRTGWTVGSGVEAAVGGNWTAKLEYLYLDLGRQSGQLFVNAFGPPGTTFNSDIREHIFRAGLNYRIGGVAPYRSELTADWRGFYLGANGGGATALNPATHTSLFNGAPNITNRFNLSPDGYIGGVQAGYNWQAGAWVYGLEADIQGSTQKDDRPCQSECLQRPLQFSRFDQRIQWFGTARGRLGYTMGSTLFYGTGGFAYGGVKTGASEALSGGGFNGSFSDTLTGWTVGGGIETPFKWLGSGWSMTTEYLYVDLGQTTGNYAFPVPAGATRTDAITSDVHQHIFRAGLNYHFNTPLAAAH